MIVLIIVFVSTEIIPGIVYSSHSDGAAAAAKPTPTEIGMGAEMGSGP